MTLNPWKDIELTDYENHMADENVVQLQTLNSIMKSQLIEHEVKTACVLGIAGGNGLEHVLSSSIEAIYGVDINESYLAKCVERFPGLEDKFHPILCDLNSEELSIPPIELMIANLLIEYIGCERFTQIVMATKPQIVSCVIQEDSDSSFVSTTDYADRLKSLDCIHNTISRKELTDQLSEIGYSKFVEQEYNLPNQKRLVRLEYQNYEY